MAKALSLNEIRRRAVQFVIDWKDTPGEERQYAQSFVRDLLGVFGITKTKAALYEKRAQRTSTGRAGFIDALVPGLALFEMKSEGADLEAAERQALDYIDGLADVEVPQWVITSDFATFRILDMNGKPGEDTEVFSLEELPERFELLTFLAGYQTRSFGDEEQEAASIKAAQLMARLYEGLSSVGYSDHDASVFLVRVLFALYADDAGIWERDLFYEFIETRTNADGSDLGPQLSMLFQILDLPTEQRQSNIDDLLKRFPYVNGGIFAESARIPSFDHDMRELLLEACAFNWSGISPAIFGSLFQAVKSPEARRELGEHYTTETNILKTISPLFLDELQENYRTVFHDKAGLTRLRSKLRDLRFLDPACGCGNFLVVAYRELRQLDLDILTRLQDLGDTSQIPMLYFTQDDLPVTLDHFKGIEIEEWPARIATTALHLADHQANQAMEMALGKAPDPLPLDTVESIHVGNALHIDWATVVEPSSNLYIMGNPPFLGDNTRDADQRADLQAAWGGSKMLSRLDFVTAWHAKTLDLFRRRNHHGEWAFVTTNSITQGDQVPRLFEPIFADGWRIKFAHQTFAWTSEAPGAAAVHCVIIGFTKDKRARQRLFTYAHPKAEPVETPIETGINAYLLDGENVLVEKRSTVLSPSLVKTEYGSKPTDGGNLIIEPHEYDEVMDDPIAAKYVHPYVGARELLHNDDRWCLWLDGMDPADLNRSPILKQRVEAVRDFRLASKAATTREYPYPHLFRQLAKQDTDYVCVPRHVSETRKYFTVALFSPDVIAGDANFTIKDPDGLQFAIMSSSMFITWQKAIGGRIKSDLRFASTLTWYTLPLPEVSLNDRAAIISAGQAVLDARALHPERSLADHYNPLAMDPVLVRAHEALDRVVDRAFGSKQALSTDTERQALLFKQYANLTEKSRPLRK